MGIIITETERIDGTKTRVVTVATWFDELLISIAKHFGRERMWRIIHWIERRKR